LAKRLLWRRRLVWTLPVVLAVMFAAFPAHAGEVLVVDAPEPLDVILVLAGETDRRPARALQLLEQGYGRRVVIDVPAAARIYEFSQVQLAEKYAQGLPQAASVRICPIEGLSTREESHDAEKCLADEKGGRILMVTSEVHPPCAERLPPRGSWEVFSVAVVQDDTQFGARWWARRQWPKTCVDEWLRLLRWTVVERWQ
jgi:hypothetical protein